MTNRSVSTTVLLIVVAFVIPMTIFAVWEHYIDRKVAPPVFNPGHSMSDFSLVDQRNVVQTGATMRGRIVVINFFFTHCPSICTRVIKNIQSVQDAFLGDSTLLFVSISVDPERDSVARLKQYIQTLGIHDVHWSFLTGDKKMIYRVARNDLQLVAAQGAVGSEDFIHSEEIVLMDTQQRIRGYYRGTKKTEINQLIIDIKKLKNESSDHVSE